MLRNAPGRLLDHPLRAAILDEVRSRPGVSFLDLRNRVLTGSAWSPRGHGTVSHHLYHLERARLVVSRRVGRHRRFFLPQHVRGAKGLAVSWDPIASSLLQLLLASPGLDRMQIARTLGWAAPSLSRPLTRLHQAGLVRHARNGRALRYWPSAASDVAPSGFSESANLRPSATVVQSRNENTRVALDGGPNLAQIDVQQEIHGARLVGPAS